MNVAGFKEALAAALRVELEPGLTISVASLPGLAILKLIPWDDRYPENNKDAADLYKLLTTFSRAGNEDRILGWGTSAATPLVWWNSLPPHKSRIC